MRNRVVIEILEKLLYEIDFDTDWYADYVTEVKAVIKELKEEIDNGVRFNDRRDVGLDNKIIDEGVKDEENKNSG